VLHLRLAERCSTNRTSCISDHTFLLQLSPQLSELNDDEQSDEQEDIGAHTSAVHVDEEEEEEEVLDEVDGADVDNTLYCLCKEIYDGRCDSVR
jgi:hypothetical protein